MSKMTKKLLAVLLATVMVMGLSITSFASTNSTHDVTVHIAKRDGNTYVSTPFSELPGQTITLTNVDSTTKLKNVVNAALAKQTTESETTFSAGWVHVPEYGDYDEYDYLDSMILAGETYGTSYKIEDYGTNQHKYTGTSWVWNYSGSTDYPSDYMDQTAIGTHTDLYLFYETSTFIY